MKLQYAKYWINKYLIYHPYNSVNYRDIINLSHRVCKSHGLRGHNIRQSIRRHLRFYSNGVSDKLNNQHLNHIKIFNTHTNTWDIIEEDK